MQDIFLAEKHPVIINRNYLYWLINFTIRTHLQGQIPIGNIKTVLTIQYFSN